MQEVRPWRETRSPSRRTATAGRGGGAFLRPLLPFPRKRRRKGRAQPLHLQRLSPSSWTPAGRCVLRAPDAFKCAVQRSLNPPAGFLFSASTEGRKRPLASSSPCGSGKEEAPQADAQSIPCLVWGAGVRRKAGHARKPRQDARRRAGRHAPLVFPHAEAGSPAERLPEALAP